jgi:glucose-6-phosphate 1-dehydrogenase
MEKPFGTDLESARKLNETVHEVFSEDQIFRIDHFLGKEAALNMLTLRFANGFLEPLWNREHIDHVQIDVPETLSIGTRGDFYEATGAYRDMASMQFSLGETPQHKDVLEAYERLIHDAMTGDHTLFTTSEGVERLWEVSAPLLERPPSPRPYPRGSWGPAEIGALIAPRHWRLPFERKWRGTI